MVEIIAGVGIILAAALIIFIVKVFFGDQVTDKVKKIKQKIKKEEEIDECCGYIEIPDIDCQPGDMTPEDDDRDFNIISPDSDCQPGDMTPEEFDEFQIRGGKPPVFRR